MSNVARTLMAGAMLAATSLGMSAVAQAQPAADNAQAPIAIDAVQLFRRGERASQAAVVTDANAIRLFRRGERASQAAGVTEADAVRLFRRGERASQ